MTRPSSAVRRIALPLSVALVGGTFASIGFAAPANAAGSQTVNQSFNYECAVTAGGLSLGDHVIAVKTTAKIPTSAYRGEKIAPTPVTLTLTMPELLRSATVGLLGGTDASGSSTDAAIVLASAGRSLTVKIPSLSAAKTAIPQVANQPWLIPAAGTVPAITAPRTINRGVTLSMPKAFTITATVYKADNSTNDAHLTCATAGGSLVLGKTLSVYNFAPKAPRALKVVTKKNKAKKFVIRASDRDRDRLTYRVTKKTKKGKVSVKGNRVTFKPKKGFKGKTSFIVTTYDGRGKFARTKVNVTVKK